MKDLSKNNTLSIIHSLIIILGVMISIGTVIDIITNIKFPKKISIKTPMEINLEAPSYLKYTKQDSLAIKFENIKGTIIYADKNPASAPILFIGELTNLTRRLLLVFIFFLMHKIMQTSINKEPFVRSNASRMQWIGYSFLAMGILRTALDVYGQSIIESNVISDYIHVPEHSSGYWAGRYLGEFLGKEMLLGICTLFVATLFKHGVAIREENKLTI